MPYSLVYIREHNTFVEKYWGEVTKQEVIQNEIEWMSNYKPQKTSPIFVTDISEAQFNHIDFHEIVELFKPHEIFLKKIKGTRIGINNGENDTVDFLKASLYAKYAEQYSIEVKNVTELDSIFTWLEQSKDEIQLIRSALFKQNTNTVLK